jgi:hypothetical protein
MKMNAQNNDEDSCFFDSLIPHIKGHLPKGWFIALLMETVSSSETSINIYQTTQCYIPEDSHLDKL